MRKRRSGYLLTFILLGILAFLQCNDALVSQKNSEIKSKRNKESLRNREYTRVCSLLPDMQTIKKEIESWIHGTHFNESAGITRF